MCRPRYIKRTQNLHANINTQHTTHVHAKTRAHAQITSGRDAPNGASAYSADAAR